MIDPRALNINESELELRAKDSESEASGLFSNLLDQVRQEKCFLHRLKGGKKDGKEKKETKGGG